MVSCELSARSSLVSEIRERTAIPRGGGGGQTPQKHKNREGTASIFVFLYAIPHRRATGAILQGSSDRLKCDDEINAHANYIDHNLDSFHQPYERTW